MAFEIATIIVFILECTPISAFWINLGGSIHFKDGAKCVDLVKYLLINGSINTVTDFALLILVSNIHSKAYCARLT